MTRPRLTITVIGVVASTVCVVVAVFTGWTWLVWMASGFLAYVAATFAIIVTDRAQTRDPKPPENVRIVTRDGVEIAVQCVYVGYRDGGHEWQIVRPRGVDSVVDVAELHVGALPGRTRIVSWEPPA